MESLGFEAVPSEFHRPACPYQVPLLVFGSAPFSTFGPCRRCARIRQNAEAQITRGVRSSCASPPPPSVKRRPLFFSLSIRWGFRSRTLSLCLQRRVTAWAWPSSSLGRGSGKAMFGLRPCYRAGCPPPGLKRGAPLCGSPRARCLCGSSTPRSEPARPREAERETAECGL